MGFTINFILKVFVFFLKKLYGLSLLIFQQNYEFWSSLRQKRDSLKKMSFCIVNVVLRTESSAKPHRQNFYKTSILGQIRCTQTLIIPKINLIFLPKNLFFNSFKVCQKRGSVSKLGSRCTLPNYNEYFQIRTMGIGSGV